MGTLSRSILLPCLRGRVGDWIFYSSLLTSEQLNSLVLKSKSIREDNSLDDYLQRELTKNTTKIKKYILENHNRFFNSIIIGVFGGIPDWYEFDLTTFRNHLNISEEDQDLASIKSSMGILSLTGQEKMFAIDGQHRVEAIKESLSIDAELLRDQYSVILVAHNDSSEGKKRTRQLFYDINQKAVKVSPGELVIIDEEKIESIVARKIYANYEYFDQGKLVSLTKYHNMPTDDKENFTNLLTIQKICKLLSKSHKISPFLKKNSKDISVSVLNEKCKNFFDLAINNVASYRDFFIEKTHHLEYFRVTNKNILFRPLGQEILVKAYLYFEDLNKDSVNIDDKIFFQKIGALNFTQNGFLRDVIWDEGKINSGKENKELALLLMLYMINSLKSEDQGKLTPLYKRISKQDSLPSK